MDLVSAELWRAPLPMASHSAAISACEKGKHWEEALRLLRELLHRSPTLDVVSYNVAISA